MTRTAKPESWHGLDELCPVIERFLTRRCRDPHQVADAVQETVMRAARYRGGLTEPSALRPWLLRIAQNVLADQARRDRRRQRRWSGDETLADVVSQEPSVEEQVDEPEYWFAGRPVARKRALAALEWALSQSAPADRSVLEAYYKGGLSSRRTADRCRIAPALVKVRLFRARARLRQMLVAQFAAGPDFVVRRAS